VTTSAVSAALSVVVPSSELHAAAASAVATASTNARPVIVIPSFPWGPTVLGRRGAGHDGRVTPVDTVDN
jgi:hypothetical protein